jgi:hypothetical protein
VKSPSVIIADAPASNSSAGCPTSISVPRQRSLCSAMIRAVPAHADMWMS